jgi:hypothetical protein
MQTKNHRAGTIRFSSIAFVFICSIIFTRRNSMQNVRLNFDFEYVFVDDTKLPKFIQVANSHIGRDTFAVGEALDDMKASFDTNAMKQTNFYTYKELTFPGMLPYNFTNIHLYEKLALRHKAQNEKMYNEVMTSIYIDHYFDYYLNAFDSSMWAFTPNYWFPESLDSILLPEQLYEKASEFHFELKNGYQLSHEWKIVDKVELATKLKVAQASQPLEKHILNTLLVAIDSDFTILISRSGD